MTALATRPARPDRPRDDDAVPEPPGGVLTVFTAQVVETRGLLARIAIQLNPYDVRELQLCLEQCTLRIVVEGDGFDAGRVVARLDKIIGVLDVTFSVIVRQK